MLLPVRTTSIHIVVGIVTYEPVAGVASIERLSPHGRLLVYSHEVRVVDADVPPSTHDWPPLGVEPTHEVYTRNAIGSEPALSVIRGRQAQLGAAVKVTRNQSESPLAARFPVRLPVPPIAMLPKSVAAPQVLPWVSSMHSQPLEKIPSLFR